MMKWPAGTESRILISAGHFVILSDAQRYRVSTICTLIGRSRTSIIARLFVAMHARQHKSVTMAAYVAAEALPQSLPLGSDCALLRRAQLSPAQPMKWSDGSQLASLVHRLKVSRKIPTFCRWVRTGACSRTQQCARAPQSPSTRRPVWPLVRNIATHSSIR
jgi:hypothetical protein